MDEIINSLSAEAEHVDNMLTIYNVIFNSDAYLNMKSTDRQKLRDVVHYARKYLAAINAAIILYGGKK